MKHRRRKDVVDRIVSAKEPNKLPIVLSSEEVVRFLQAVPGLRSRAALTNDDALGKLGTSAKSGQIVCSKTRTRHLLRAVPRGSCCP